MKHAGLVLSLVYSWVSLQAGAVAQTAVPPAAGDGASTGTAYQITELGNLVWLRDQAAVNATAGKYYKLMNDIVASDTATWNDASTSTATLEGFNPIGRPDGSGWPFKGVFLGEGHAITGLFIHRTIYGVGLFGGIGTEGRVSNLRLIGGTVVAGDHGVGGLVGQNKGAVLLCSNTGSVNAGGSDVGGLVGYNAGGTVSQCYATGDVTGNVGATITSATGIGGLVGTNTGTVSQSYATGAVTTGDAVVGGLVGNNHSGGTVSQCHATGAVLGYQYVGGLIGGSGDGTISQCYATGAVTGNESVGGLAGRPWYCTISRCYATGAVTGIQWDLYVGRIVGGLVGECYEATVPQCYATGTVEGDNLIGGLAGASGNSTVSQCYAIGAVSGTENVGGLIGNSGGGTISDAYWNTETSGMATSTGGTGLTTAQMRQQATFSNWDFTTTPVWGIQGAYPYLTDLATCALTYTAGAGGQVADGLTTGTALAQVINLASTGTPVTAIADQQHKFLYWSDRLMLAVRWDAGLTEDMSVTAIFDERRTVAREWPRYR